MPTKKEKKKESNSNTWGLKWLDNTSYLNIINEENIIERILYLSKLMKLKFKSVKFH